VSSGQISNKMNNILVIGASGGLSSLVIENLLKDKKNHIIGIDPRKNKHLIKSKRFSYIQDKYKLRSFEKIFRQYEIHDVYHIGRMSHTSFTSDDMSRFETNLIGTKNLLDLCEKNQIKRFFLLSTFHIYGALPDNTTFLTEDSPLRASIKHPELRDIVEMDNLVTSWMWKNKDSIQTVIYRPCNIIGPSINNSISKYFSTPLMPKPIDFNPMIQLIGEKDIAYLIAQSSQLETGIYNVAPDTTVSLKKAHEILDLPRTPVALFLTQPVVNLINKVGLRFPHYLIDYIKYPCIIDGSRLNQIFSKKLKLSDTKKTLYSLL